MNRRQTGSLGEDIATKYLKNQGYQIIDRNVERRWGEIDIVAQKNNIPIFVEVKTVKQKSSFGSPFAKITARKKQTIQRCAELFLIEKDYSENKPFRIDAIGITLDCQNQKAKLKHLKDIL